MINQELFKYMVDFRRTFHQNPEVGYECYNTSKIVADELKSLGYEVVEGIAKTAVIASLNLGYDKTIGVRADMDALKMSEDSDCDFKSNNGCMHACGHDMHTSMLLGLAKYFSLHKDELTSNLKLIFQPAEEGPLPGGAVPIIESGIVDDVDVFFAYHVTNKHYVGQVGIKYGTAFAARLESLPYQLPSFPEI